MVKKSIYIGDGVKPVKLYRAMVRISESRWLEWLESEVVARTFKNSTPMTAQTSPTLVWQKLEKGVQTLNI